MNLIIRKQTEDQNSSAELRFNYAYHLKFIFKKAYGNNFFNLYSFEEIRNIKINKRDFLTIKFFITLIIFNLIKENLIF